MNITTTTASLTAQKRPAVILYAFENEPVAGLPLSFQPLLRSLSKKEFHGASKQSIILHTDPSQPVPRILLIGLGKRAEFTLESFRRATGPAISKLQSAGITEIAIGLLLNTTPSCPLDDLIHAAVETTVLASYRFSDFKSDDNHVEPVQSLVLHLPSNANRARAAATARHAFIVADAANYTRQIANLPGNIITPAALAQHAITLARQHRLKSTILDKRALIRGGFGGLLAVGCGSANDPRLIVLEYNGARSRSAPPIALVGKAITFDTGGISIKPSDKMDEMKFDKCGGVTVLGALRAAAQLKLPVNILGVIAAAENMPSATSYRPGDIVTSYRGTDKRGVTIEVLNTDAEGRVVLGDALVFARQRKPSAIIDLATLTGACVIALGTSAAGLLGNDDPLIERIRAAGEHTGERCWPLPLWQDYKDKIKSDVADIKNTGGRYGGAITAAAFLSKYVGSTPWAHLDIAGTAWSTENHPYLGKGATGFGVRLLTRLLNAAT